MALLILTYLTLSIFIVAFAWRAYFMASLPVHLRWELAPVPHEKGKAQYGGSYLEEFEWWTKPREKSLLQEGLYMFKEIVFLKGVWDHNPRLWKFSWPFHFGIYVLLAMVGSALLAALGLNGFRAVTLGLAWLGYSLGCLGTAGLLFKRLTDSNLRPFTTAAARFNLVFLLAVFGTGLWSLLTIRDFAGEASSFLKACLSADAGLRLATPAAVHVVLVLAFVAYLPFSQMMHFLAKYFTYHEVRWNDEPMTAGSRMETEVAELLQQPITWAAGHLGAGAKRSWVDVATKEDSGG